MRGMSCHAGGGACVPAGSPVACAWTRRHLLGLEELSAGEMLGLLDTAASFKEVSTRSIKKVPALRGRVVVNLFFESSTRTRVSFGLAAQRLSADVVDFSAVGSSTSKGETLKDTARNLEAMGIDVVVLRHPAPGAAKVLADCLDATVINAGDGPHEHPTQGLLDIFTIREHCAHKLNGQGLQGLTVGIVGDIAHSRVARSNIHGLRTLGARVVLVGPPTLVPASLAELGCEVSWQLDEVLPELDVINMLRIQKERQQSGLFPSLREYSRFFGLNARRMARARKDVLVLHPGPMNRGVEITPDVADGPRSVILEQVANGLAVRMAAMVLCSSANDVARAERRKDARA